METLALQQALIARGYPVGPTGADGLPGKNTTAAVRAFQTKAGLPVTGLADAATVAALNAALGYGGPGIPVAPILPVKNVWPLQASVRAFYGAPGTNQVILQLPYAMTYDGKPVTRMTINAKCAPSAERALTQIAKEYSEADRLALGLSIFGGCFNNRPMRGGTQLSMHAYACAIDFDPNRNQLKWGRDKARLAKKDCEAFWRAWEAEGWVSLGRLRNFDWMHVQAARL